jgi:hypothetical protein
MENVDRKQNFTAVYESGKLGPPFRAHLEAQVAKKIKLEIKR